MAVREVWVQVGAGGFESRARLAGLKSRASRQQDNNTMTDTELVKDGQLQVESLKTVLDNDALTTAAPCIVLVVDEDSTMGRLFMHGFEDEARSVNRCLMPLLGAALSELARQAMSNDPEALAVVGKFFGRERAKIRARRSLTGLLAELTEEED